MGKGSKRRPMQIEKEKFEDNWEKVFGEKTKKTPKKERYNKRWYDNKGEIE